VRKQVVKVDQFKITQKDMLEISGSALYDNGVKNANIRFKIKDIEKAKPFISPFTESTAFEETNVKGKIIVDLIIKNNSITDVACGLHNLSINDPQLKLNKANGTVSWSKTKKINSHLSWDKLIFKKIPFEKNELNFFLQDKQAELTKSVYLKTLKGIFHIDVFKFNYKKEIEVEFKGDLKNISLDQLTLSLDVIPLSGSISGNIPSIYYKNDKFHIDGRITLDIFDGTIVINKLASSGLFTQFSKLNTDIEFNNLDLNEITKKIKIGNIKGRVTGYAKNVYLENWSPITFFAWIGTSEGSNSTKTISHQAVKNIASIGGGSAENLVTSTMLRFFDDFNYSELGIGCYLNNGVCQMMGVEVVGSGYYLVKGRWIPPSINLIGYNTSVSWDVLMQRLGRITQSEDYIIN